MVVVVVVVVDGHGEGGCDIGLEVKETESFGV